MADGETTLGPVLPVVYESQEAPDAKLAPLSVLLLPPPTPPLPASRSSGDSMVSRVSLAPEDDVLQSGLKWYEMDAFFS